MGPTFANRLEDVRGRIARAAERSGRTSDAVTLIAVSKTHPASAVAEALKSGLTDFGENRVQEGVAKAAEVASLLATSNSQLATPPRDVGENRVQEGVAKAAEVASLLATSNSQLATPPRDFGENRVQEGVAKAAEVASLLATRNSQLATPPRWHLIGHLQTNKVRAALQTFAILHAVDSERLLQAISAAAANPIPVMIEVNVAAEPSKYGIAPAQLPALLARARELPNIEVRGLMTVAPLVSEAELARGVFAQLRELAAAHQLAELSMGMTNDYEVAIEEGATHVRIGRALFGERE